jgi:hypothetical protein
MRSSIHRSSKTYIGLALLLALGSVEASQVRPVNLEELTGRADRIFSGRCVSTEVVAHPERGFAVTRVTFAVERAVKGQLGETVTIDLFGGPATGLAEVPRFAPGERAVLFLYADSGLGLTSPVALGHGKFSLVRDKAGRELAINAFGNRNLLTNLSSAARERVAAPLAQADGAAVPVEALLDGVQGLVQLQASAASAR